MIIRLESNLQKQVGFYKNYAYEDHTLNKVVIKMKKNFGQKSFTKVSHSYTWSMAHACIDDLIAWILRLLKKQIVNIHFKFYGGPQ